MCSAIKTLVSKNKSRFKEDNYNLDLSYIAKNIIAMGYPACTLEGIYRNHIDDVAKFFHSRHSQHYLIFNLCAEKQRTYNTDKFEGCVETKYSFHDHNPPPFEQLRPFCEHMAKWLDANDENVVAVHCKAGKGRTGVMVCAYLVHAGFCRQVDDELLIISGAHRALEYYGTKRTRDGKGVTIQSQRRYIFYYDELVKRKIEYRPQQLKLLTLIITNGRAARGKMSLGCQIMQSTEVQPLKAFKAKMSRRVRSFLYDFKDLFLSGDIKLQFYLKGGQQSSQRGLYQLCFNSSLVKFSTDIMTIAVEVCTKCSNSLSVYVLNTKNEFLDTSKIAVIDLTFLSLVHARESGEDVKFCHCDCPLLAENSFFDRPNSTSTATTPKARGSVLSSLSLKPKEKKIKEKSGQRLEGAHHSKHRRVSVNSNTVESPEQEQSNSVNVERVQPAPLEKSGTTGTMRSQPPKTNEPQTKTRWLYMVAFSRNMDKTYKYGATLKPQKPINLRAIKHILSQVALRFEDDLPAEKLDILAQHTPYGKRMLEEASRKPTKSTAAKRAFTSPSTRECPLI